MPVPFPDSSESSSPETATGPDSLLAMLVHGVVENAWVDNLEAMFARYKRPEADNEGYFQDRDLLSCEAVETILRCKPTCRTQSRHRSFSNRQT